MSRRLVAVSVGDGERALRVERSTVIVDAGAQRVGIVVDAVEEVLTVQDEQLEPLPAGADPARVQVANLGERLVVHVDPAAVAA